MENIKNMTPKLIGETWRKYPTETSKQKSTYGLFECQYCKKEFEAITKDIKSGCTKSCGCQKNKQKITHGLNSNRFYLTWNNMIHRCNNPKNKYYKNYGARGITVCEEWLDIKNFIAWAEATHPNIEGVSLDRIDNDKGYSPENCRWADRTTQSINQRIKKNNTSGVLGIYWGVRDKRWVAKIRHKDKTKWIGQFISIEDAIEARNNYILVNKLPNPLSVLITK